MRQPGFLQPTSASTKHERWSQTSPFIPLLSPTPRRPTRPPSRRHRCGAHCVPVKRVQFLPPTRGGRGAGGTRLPPSPPPARLPESSRRLRRRPQTQALSAMAATATPPATSGATRSPGGGGVRDGLTGDGARGAGAGAGLAAGLAAGAHLSRWRSGSWAGHL